MYPLLATPTRTFLYVLAWVPIALALAAVMYLIEPRPAWTLAAVTGPLCLLYASAATSAWWIIRGERSDDWLTVGFAFRILGAAVVTATLWAIAANMLYTFLDPKLPESIDIATRRKDLLLIFVAGLGIYWLSAALHLAFHISLKAVESERRALESQVTAREAELKALRSQLNPHFLFNSLNSIMSLVGRSPEEARRMCQGLGDFLRRTLNLGARERVSLEEELDLVRHYLEIEAVRFGSRLTYDLDVPADLKAIPVPPLLLQPLIENAVKHGVASRLDGGRIRLIARREGDNLHVAVVNPLDDEAAPAGGEGMGLDNVRRRLKVSAAGRGTLEVRRRADEFEAHLVLPLDPAGQPAAAPEVVVP
jgi:two-component system sensor histidine kinase AlgZ